MLTLCTLVPLRHAWLFFSSSSFSMLPPSSLGVDCSSPFLGAGYLSPLLGAGCLSLLLGADCLSPPLLGSPALPRLLPLNYPQFPWVLINALLLWGTGRMSIFWLKFFIYTKFLIKWVAYIHIYIYTYNKLLYIKHIFKTFENSAKNILSDM
jgi:hypothetical protein